MNYNDFLEYERRFVAHLKSLLSQRPGTNSRTEYNHYFIEDNGSVYVFWEEYWYGEWDTGSFEVTKTEIEAFMDSKTN